MVNLKKKMVIPKLYNKYCGYFLETTCNENRAFYSSSVSFFLNAFAISLASRKSACNFVITRA